MSSIVSTYRLQLHKEFCFENLERSVPYLEKLGISTIYASPIFKAVPGSNHGYDGLDPQQINPELGTKAQLKAISERLRENGMHWLQDIVPNHMAFDTGNPWLMDVLEKGPRSRYASFFDTCWGPRSSGNAFYEDRLMVPFLGATLDEVLERGELRIACRDGRFVFEYFDAAYPLQPLSYDAILSSSRIGMPQAITDLCAAISGPVEEGTYGTPWEDLRLEMEKLMGDESLRESVENSLKRLNEDKEFLRSLADQQFYRLCHWGETDRRINYRRFFTINGLICLNIQEESVFEWYHEFTTSLVREGIFQGLRIDHIDGLHDPTQYLERLRKAVGEDVPILVEKILEPGESLPGFWPVQGSTGYDFLAIVNNLFTNGKNDQVFTKFYRTLVRDHRSVREQIDEKKASILYTDMAGDLENLYQWFRESDLVDKKAFASVRTDDVKEVIAEFLVHCHVYRYYGSRFPLDKEEARQVLEILRRVRYLNTDLQSAVDLFEGVLLRRPHEGDKALNTRIAGFYQRCMQFTGPLMAKGVEDTLMYTHNRFVGHNEVGDWPGAFGISVKEFHQAMGDRQKQWPFSLNATSSHDTKRGEDVRARLNVLTDLEQEWFETVRGWMRETEPRRDSDEAAFLDRNDEYFIYQTIVGAHPMAEEGSDDFLKRLQEYLEKALREGKVHSTWTHPNVGYETAAKKFAEEVLSATGPFADGLRHLLEATIDHGIVNSLGQLILKFTCPGIPDVYQGCELWDLSLVDPDNRRPVDFATRMAWLEDLERDVSPTALWRDRRSGRIKLWLTRVLAWIRKERADVFAKGDYVPLKVIGDYKDHVLAFSRKYRQQVLVVVLPLHTAAIGKEQGVGVEKIDWKETAVQLPRGMTGEWMSVFTESKIHGKNRLLLGNLFQDLPFAILEGQHLTNERGAGILLHVSSLPSSFGIGDVGPEARAFANFLHRCRQKYWQLLPLNPVEEQQSYSPYSSISSRAGNVLFISPELLARDGLLSSDELRTLRLPQKSKVDYAGAVEGKSALFDKAWETYQRLEDSPLHADFEGFRRNEEEWLDDFALYALLKRENAGKPWFEWEPDVKLREAQALENLKQTHSDELRKIEWLQFLFARQWHELKDYCNQMGIQLIGDLPIYVSYDSADVWSHRRLFALDEEGGMTGMAGVPPDAFSADGQLWGMPVFEWDVLKQENYEWWIQRLRKNMELFDVVRLDHFRAFSSYWEVPAGEATARNGEWKQGPGDDFFRSVQNAFGRLPFVAEDLGDIDASVYELRDAFHLAGMKVLQFAFGEDMPYSVHIPHNHGANFLVYTGTHDNNTTRGWFAKEVDEETRKAIERYLGRSASADEISGLFARMAYGSVASIAILPMQDVLDLDEAARMNTPASVGNNWGWRLVPGQLTGREIEKLREWVAIYNRE